MGKDDWKTGVDFTITNLVGQLQDVGAATPFLQTFLTGWSIYRGSPPRDNFQQATRVLDGTTAALTGAAWAGGQLTTGGVSAGWLGAGLVSVAGFASMGSMVLGIFASMGADAAAGIAKRADEGKVDGFHLGFAAGVMGASFEWTRSALDPYPDGPSVAGLTDTQALAAAEYVWAFKAELARGHDRASGLPEEARVEYQLCVFRAIVDSAQYVSPGHDDFTTVTNAVAQASKHGALVACLRDFHDTDQDGAYDASGPPGSSWMDLAPAAEQAEEICVAVLEDLPLEIQEAEEQASLLPAAGSHDDEPAGTIDGSAETGGDLHVGAASHDEENDEPEPVVEPGTGPLSNEALDAHEARVEGPEGVAATMDDGGAPLQPVPQVDQPTTEGDPAPSESEPAGDDSPAYSPDPDEPDSTSGSYSPAQDELDVEGTSGREEETDPGEEGQYSPAADELDIEGTGDDSSEDPAEYQGAENGGGGVDEQVDVDR